VDRVIADGTKSMILAAPAETGLTIVVSACEFSRQKRAFMTRPFLGSPVITARLYSTGGRIKRSTFEPLVYDCLELRESVTQLSKVSPLMDAVYSTRPNGLLTEPFFFKVLFVLRDRCTLLRFTSHPAQSREDVLVI